MDTADKWAELLISIGIPSTPAKSYAEIFADNELHEEDIPDLTKEILLSLSITTLGHQLKIIRYGKRSQATRDIKTDPDIASKESSQIYKSPSASASVKLPNISSNMTHPQFRKALVDWNVYKAITAIPRNNFTAHLYSACEASVQSSLINAKPDFLELPEEDALKIIEQIVTKLANPAVHRKDFYTIKQSDTESIQEFIVRLQTASPDCEFTCPNCSYDLSEMNIRDQFIRGLNNTVIQTDILTKASQLATLEKTTNHAKSIESALRDQLAIEKDSQKPDSIGGIRQSQYRQNKYKSMGNNQKKQSPQYNQNQQQQQKPCTGCGSLYHRSNERERKCPGWGKNVKTVALIIISLVYVLDKVINNLVLVKST